MKIQVRQGCFETNSSSQHCIAILNPARAQKKDDEYYGYQLTGDWLKPGTKIEINQRYVIDDDSIRFERWPFRTLTTMFEKVQYAYAAYGPEKLDELSALCEELTGHGIALPKHDGYEFFNIVGLSDEEIDDIIESEKIPAHRIVDKWKVHYDNDEEAFYTVDARGQKFYDIERCDTETVDEGYIDHQSIGMLQSFLEKHNITLREFLTNPQYIVIIDGDEYNQWDKMFDAGLCNKNDYIETGLHKGQLC